MLIQRTLGKLELFVQAALMINHLKCFELLKLNISNPDIMRSTSQIHFVIERRQEMEQQCLFK